MHPNDGHVASNFVVQALRGEDITIYCERLQTRTFCYGDDLIEGFIRFMNLQPGQGGIPGVPAPINLGNPFEFTILQLVEKVIELMGSKSRLVFKLLPSDDPMQRKPDISRAQELLNGRIPRVALEDRLNQTIRYFDELMQNAI